MKKFLLPLLSLVVASSVSAAGFKKPMAVNTNVAPMADVVIEELPMGYVLSALYDDANYRVPNFYVILSSDENARYDQNTGDINAPANSFTLILDLFAHPGDEGRMLPDGTYNMLYDDAVEQPFGFTHEYSMLNFYDYTSGQISIQLENPIEVSHDENGIYTISTLVNDGTGNLIRVKYNGPLVIGSSTEKPTVFPQIQKNINAHLDKGGVSFYEGVTDYSNYGVSELNLFSCEVDASNSYKILSEGYQLNMMIAHKRFKSRGTYELCPGTYVNATNLNRDTWYPCREITYYGTTYPFGSFIREIKKVNGEFTYTYAYLKSGTFTIVDNGDGTYSGTLDAVTTLGYEVKLTWSGKVDLNDDNAVYTATVSDLEDDVLLDFSKLNVGRVYHNGVQGGCRTLIVDLGSPSGKDEGIQYGGDLLRMEFLVDQKYTRLESGIYTVVPRRWNSDELKAGGMYEPWSLNKGYFDGNGAQIGTRYAHVEEGRYMVYDMVGPAEEGEVIVEADENHEVYKFTINLQDDAGFKIEGYWEKPIIEMYNPDAIEVPTDPDLSGIENVDADSNAVKVVKEGSNLVVLNGGNSDVELFDVEGRHILSAPAGQVVPVDHLGKGIYIVKVNNATVKVAL